MGRTRTSRLGLGSHGDHRPHTAGQSAARHLFRHLHGCVRGFVRAGAHVRAARRVRRPPASAHVRRPDRALCRHRSQLERDGGPRFFCLRAQSACFLQRAGARHHRARRRRLPGADRVILHDRLRRGVPQHRLLCRSRLHGSAVRAVHAQARRLHAADVPRAPFREPHRAHRRGGGAVRAHPPSSGGRGPVCRLCCGVAPGAVGAPDGAAGGGLRRRLS